MLITPPDLAWGCSFKGLWAFCFWMPGSIGCDAAFSCAALPLSDSLIALRWYGRAVGPGLRPILALAGRLACHSTAPTLQFLYSGQARSGTFAFRRGGRAVKALPASRRTRLVGHPGAQLSPLVSDASGGGRTAVVG